ncbi:substrate-binding periplasmic protein [Sedimenticola sp.]|uniref:substrate-binding periplasmic protein n=2 Tax=Sedimenticola sp. TaxID=1940285 RepID=UPI003D102F6C
MPPYNYTQDDALTGVSTEVVKRVMELAGEDYSIKSYPWARSYVSAQSGPGNLIYSINRIEKREKLFKWIGEIAPNTTSVYALKTRTDIQANSLDDIQKFAIVTTFRDAKEMYLISKGFNKLKFARLSGKDTNLRAYKLLKDGTVDVWPMTDAVAYHIARQNGDDPDKIFRKVIPVAEVSTKGYYIAASLDTPNELVAHISTTLEKFKTTEEYKSILKRWGL